MKVIAINGSPHKEGNTFHAFNMVGKELIAVGIDFEIVHIGHKPIHGCKPVILVPSTRMNNVR